MIPICQTGGLTLHSPKKRNSERAAAAEADVPVEETGKASTLATPGFLVVGIVRASLSSLSRLSSSS